MCGDTHVNYVLSALVAIVADESNPLSTTMRRLCLSRLRELENVSEMMRLVTGRDDWKRMTTDECLAIQRAAHEPCDGHAGDNIAKLLADMRTGAAAARTNGGNGVADFVLQWIDRLQSLTQPPCASHEKAAQALRECMESGYGQLVEMVDALRIVKIMVREGNLGASPPSEVERLTKENARLQSIITIRERAEQESNPEHTHPHTCETEPDCAACELDYWIAQAKKPPADLLEAYQRVSAIALWAAGTHAERVVELEAEVSTLRESLAEQNRLLSLNVTEVERLRDAHAEPQWLSDPERDEVIDVLSKVLCLPAGSMSDEEAKEEGREVCERLQRHRSTTQPPPADPFASKYHELLLAVESKFPGESCHETALRYIRSAERHDSLACSAETKGGE